MPTAASPSLIDALTRSALTRLTERRARTRRLPEPADMGTAFGMEQWLDERDHQARPSLGARARHAWLPRWLQPASAR